MKKLKFLQLQKDNKEHYKLFESLMIPYNKELDEHYARVTSEDTILAMTRGMLNMQGASDRHLEVCYDGERVVGFLYCKVDHGGHKGYIMEFYVKPKFRRSGYGKDMFKHLEQLFALQGTKRMYLTAGPVTGEPFWQAMGFEKAGEVSPENGLAIFEKDVIKQTELITIINGKYLTNEMAQKIAMAQWRSDHPEWVNRIRDRVYCDAYFYDCFCVVAVNQNDDVIGRLYCIQNERDKSLWYYGDLCVIPSYRRMGIAGRMVKTAADYLREMNAKALRCYVESENRASIALQKSLGFHERPYEKFNDLMNDGDIMFELVIPSAYSVMPATENEARFVTRFYAQNIEALHGTKISLDEFRAMLTSDDPDEQNFLICRGCMPVAWLKTNGLQSQDMAWISMLAVSDKHQRQGAGKYAVEFAEQYISSKGFSKVGIHTTDDNIAAQSLCRKCGYTITEYGEFTMSDGKKRMVYTFEKLI